MSEREGHVQDALVPGERRFKASERPFKASERRLQAPTLLLTYPLRLHPPPLERGLAELVELAGKSGVTIDASNSLSLQRSLDEFTRKEGGTDEERALKHQAITSLLTSPMQPAEYFCAGSRESVEWRHFALNIPYYTHFTSPIRRYADVMVHRLLQASLEGEESVDGVGYDVVEVGRICDNCNERKLASKKAQERSDRVFLCLYLKKFPMEDAMGVVIGMGDKSFMVLVPALGLEGRVYLDDTKDDLEYRGGDDEARLNGGVKTISVVKKSGVGGWSVLKIKMFEKVRLRIKCRDEPPVDVKLLLKGPW